MARQRTRPDASKLKREVRQELELLKEVGWRFDGLANNGHVILRHEHHGTHQTGATPSDVKALKANRTQLARKMGIPLGDLEKAMGVKQVMTQDAATRRKRRRRGDRQRQDFSRLHYQPKPPPIANGRASLEVVPDPEPDPHEGMTEVEIANLHYNEAQERAARARMEGLDLPTIKPISGTTTVEELEEETERITEIVDSAIEVHITSTGKQWDRVCLWCGEPIPPPKGKGRPPTTCFVGEPRSEGGSMKNVSECAKNLGSLRAWSKPIKLETHAQVVKMDRIRRSVDKLPPRQERKGPDLSRLKELAEELEQIAAEAAGEE